MQDFFKIFDRSVFSSLYNRICLLSTICSVVPHFVYTNTLNIFTHMTKSKFSFIFAFICFSLNCLSQAEVPEGFIVEWYLKNWDKPVDIDFDSEGNMYVSEKEGSVWIVKNDEKQSEPLINIKDEVGNWGDQGLLSFALDPEFKSNGFIYLYYVVDRYHLLNSDLPEYNPLRDWYWGPTIVRVTRYQTDEKREKADLSSRQVLIGDSVDNGVPSLYTSHTGGTLDFGDDGTLLVSTGDGSTWKKPYGGDGPPFHEEYVEHGLRDGIIREEEEVGGFRPQIINNRNGKILRIDPMTGQGISSNPYFDPANPSSAESQVYAMGFRNLYRMKVREGSGSTNPDDALPGVIYAMDVGNAHWEELNVVKKAGGNFGWPLFEGTDIMPEFTAYETVNKDVPFMNEDCGNGHYRFKDLIQSPILKYPFNSFNDSCGNTDFLTKATHVMIPPAIGFAHGPAGGGFWVPVYDGKGELGRIKIGDPGTGVYGKSFGMFGQCGIVGGFYKNKVYPETYQNKLFVGDYNQGWIKYVEMDLNDDLVGIGDFFQDTIAITHLEINPFDGALYFIDYPNGIKRITYGQNSKPISKPKANILYGASPLTIQFNANESFDPNGDPISYIWDFGDGNTSDQSGPEHIYIADDTKSFIVSLTVTDSEGLASTETLLVSVNNTPPTVNISSFTDGQTYSVNGITYLDLEAEVTDNEHTESELSYVWNVYLGHNTHEHGEPSINTKKAETRLLPAGCDGELYYYRIELEVTDPVGLIGRDSKRLIPDCGGEFVKLFSFTAQANGDKTNLDWVTINERTVNHFIVQRKGAYDEEYVDIGQEEGTNLQQAIQKYAFTDENPLLNLNIYRLLIVSENGEEAFSEEQEVFVIPKDALLVYPNPTKDKLNLLFGSQYPGKTFQLYDMTGALILESVLHDDSSFFSINVRSFNTGIYTYRILSEDLLKTGKIYIE